MSLFSKCRVLHPVLFLLVVSSALGLNCSAQITSGNQAAAPPSVRQLALNVLVVDKSGVPDSDLRASDFHISIDGSPRTVQSAVTGAAPVSIVFLIDTSGSMYRQKKNVADLVKAVTRTLPSGSEVMFIEFAQWVTPVKAFTPVSIIDLSFLDAPSARGGSSVFDAVVEGERYMAEQARNARRALILLSDGNDNSSNHSSKDTISAVHWPGAPTLYLVDIYDDRDTESEVRHARKGLEAIADSGGGMIFDAMRERNFETCGMKVAAAIQSQYLLGYIATNLPSSAMHKVQIELTAPQNGMSVHAIREYMGPVQ